jgi:hypothetical protein
MNVKQRVRRLEEQTQPAEDWQLVVDWGDGPEPGPGDKVVYWPSDEDRDQAEQEANGESTAAA